MQRIRGRRLRRNRSRMIGAAAITATLSVATAVTAIALPSDPAAPATPAAQTATTTPGGNVFANQTLPQSKLVPGSASAQRYIYWTSGINNSAQMSSATMYVPKGATPEAGWPVVAVAHSAAGLTDQCTPSLGSQPDRNFMSQLLSRGYAVVVSDYAGLGTGGSYGYRDGMVEARNIVDAVRSAADVGAKLSPKWAVVGQSAGAGAALTTARYAPTWQGSNLNFRGAVASGVPAYTEDTISNLGPSFPPIALPPAITTDILYSLAGLRSARPAAGVDSYLTPAGQSWIDKAETMCAPDLQRATAGLNLNTLFNKPLTPLRSTLASYFALPNNGFDRPVMLQQGLLDTDVVLPYALTYANAATTANGQVSLRTYPANHQDTIVTGMPDTTNFLATVLR